MESTPVVFHQHTGFFNFLPLLFSAFLVLVVVVMIEHVPVVVGKLLFCCYRFRFEREFCWVTDCSLTAVGEINNAGRLSIGRMTTKIANNFYFFYILASSTNQINKSSTWAVFHRILWMRFHSGAANSHQPEPVFFFFNSLTGTITWRTFYPVKTTKWNKADGLPCITWLFWLGIVSLSRIFSFGVFLTIKVLTDLTALSVVWVKIAFAVVFR